MAAIIARVCGLQLFSTEIVWATDGRLLSVDYVNDPLDLRMQSKAAEGVPDAIVASVAECIADWVADQTRPRVRLAAEADIPALLPLLEELGRPHADLSDMRVTDVYREHIADPDRLVLVVELGGRVVGMVEGTFRTRLNWTLRELWACDLIVAEVARGHGAGRALVNDLVARARRVGCRRITLESGPSRRAAHHIYQSLGFEDRGVYLALNL
jgi:GNAT superfamily N-acetyltransferase